MSKRLMAATLCAILALGMLPAGAAAAGADAVSVPTVQSYAAASGTFTLARGARLFIAASSDPTGTELGNYIQLADSEFAAKGIPSSSAMPIVYGDESAAQSGDIIVKIDAALAASAYGTEGYKLAVTESNITVSALTAAGAFYGLRTVLKSMAAGGTALACCTVSDAPQMAERAVMVDAGRKYFTKDWIVSLIREMSWSGLNELMLDISNDGFRLKLDDMSLSYNGTTADLTSALSSQYLTQSEMDEIIAAGQEYHVAIVPMLNTPGHMTQILTAFSSLKFSGSSNTLDITNSTARAFGEALVQKYAAYFAGKGCKYFHVGGDEFANDVYSSGSMGFGALVSQGTYGSFISYINELDAIVTGLGMTSRVWNDGVYFGSNTSYGTFNSDIQITDWTGGWSGYTMAPASLLVSKGHTLINCHGDYLYYVLGKADATASESKIYGFSNTVCANGTVSASSVAGSMYCVWCDYPDAQTETQVAAGIWARMRAFAERVWNEDSGTSLSTLQSRESAVGSAPGGFSASGTLDTAALPAASAIAAAAVKTYTYTLSGLSLTAARTSLTAVKLSWTAPAVTPETAETVTYTLTKTVGGNTTTLVSGTADTAYTDADASDAASYTVTASLTGAAPLTAATSVKAGGVAAFTDGVAVPVISGAKSTSYTLDTDGIDSGNYVLVVYNTNNETSSNYYAVSTDAKADASPYGLVTTCVTSGVDTAAGTVDISSLSARSYVWTVAKSGSTYTLTAADGKGTVSIDGRDSVTLTGGSTALALTAGSRTNAYYVNYSGTNGYRFDMYSDRSGYQPANGQCLLSAWSTSGTGNHNNVYFYRQTAAGGTAAYQADNSGLLALIASAQALDSSLYPNWSALGIDGLIAAAQTASKVTASADAATAAGEQSAINAAGEALYAALLKLSTDPVTVVNGYVTVDFCDDAGSTMKPQQTLTGAAGTQTTVTADPIDGYTTPAPVTVTFGSGTTQKIVMEYVLATDKTALAAELASVAPAANFTADSYAPYASAVAAAQTVYAKDRALQSEVDAALLAVQNAKTALVKAAAVKSATPSSMTVTTNKVYYGAHLGPLAVDGDASTYTWLAGAQKAGDWLCVTFDDVYTLDAVSVVSSYASDYIRGADIQVSADGKTWTTVGTIAGSGSSSAMTVYTSGYVDAKMVRIVLTEDSRNWWVVNDISFDFGTASTAAPTPVYALTTNGITSGAEYVVKSWTGDYALAVSNGELTAVPVTPDNGTITTADKNEVWIITASGTGFTMRNKGTGDYLQLSGSTSRRSTSSAGAGLGLSAEPCVIGAALGSAYIYFFVPSLYTYSKTYLSYSEGFTVTVSFSSSARRMSLYILQ